jgi:hypothetical protein
MRQIPSLADFWDGSATLSSKWQEIHIEESNISGLQSNCTKTNITGDNIVGSEI